MDEPLYGQDTIEIQDVFHRSAEIRDELEELERLEHAGCSTFVRADHFSNDWVIQYAEDMVLFSNKSIYDWPFSCIDWEKAADELKQDFTEIQFGDETYYGR